MKSYKSDEIRLTMSAFFFGIERDLKNAILEYITPYQENISFFQDKALESKVISRFKKDNPGGNPENNIEELIENLDFQDTFVLLNKNKSLLPDHIAKYLISTLDNLYNLSPIRNRVVHVKPLLSDDFFTLSKYIQTIDEKNPIIYFNTVKTKKNIDDGTFNFATLSNIYKIKNDRIGFVKHNLPIPEFDETGFIGRSNDVEDIKKSIINSRVVSILGEGGIGKTALAIRVAYDLIDMDENCPFELIIWTSAKSTMLTPTGINEIYNAITDYTGLMSVILDNSNNIVVEKNLEDILNFLDVFKTLIIIDNFETIHNQQIRDFIRAAQTKCHILITSRIGLGELELPKNLSGLKEIECTKLLRDFAKVKGCKLLISLPNHELIRISKQLYWNPLAIKWFVSAVDSGKTLNEVLNHKEDLLNFCLSNIYEKLSDESVVVLNTIRSARKKISSAELILLLNFPPIEARKYINEIIKTSFVKREINEVNKNYEEFLYVPDFAKEYLLMNHPIDKSFVDDIITKIKRLNQETGKIKQINNNNTFDIYAFPFHNQHDKFSNKLLSNALYYSKGREFEMALKKVNEAKDVSPSNCEVYRVGAFIKTAIGDYLAAEEYYKTGLEINSDNIRLLYFYSDFLLYRLNDEEGALDIALKLVSIVDDNDYANIRLSQCYQRNSQFESSVSVLDKLILKGNLPKNTYIIVNTEIINSYREWGRSEVNIKRDFDNGKLKFEKAFSVFIECSNLNITDKKMIDSFYSTINYFIDTIPSSELINNLEICKNIILDNFKFFDFKALNPDVNQNAHQESEKSGKLSNLINKFSRKFGDESLNYLKNIDAVKVREMGRIQKKTSPTFDFIQTNDGRRFFAHWTNFIDIASAKELERILEGQWVEFTPTSNSKGPNAINIRIQD